MPSIKGNKQNLLKRLIDYIELPAFITDENTNIILINSVAKTLYGNIQVNSNSIYDLLPDIDLNELNQLPVDSKVKFKTHSIEKLQVDDNNFFLVCFKKTKSKSFKPKESLKQYFNNLELIVNNIPSMIWLKDSNNKILFANKVARENLKLDYFNDNDKFYKHAKEFYKQDLDLIFEDKKSINYFETSSGDKKLSTKKIFLDNTNFNRKSLILSEDNVNNQELKTSYFDKVIKPTLRLADIGFFNYDLELQHFNVDEHLKEILGSEDDISYHQFFSCIHADDQSTFKEFFSKLLTSNQPVKHEFRYICVNGSFYKSLRFGAEKYHNSLRGFVQDISDTYKIHTKYENFIQVSKQVFFILDFDYNIVEYNHTEYLDQSHFTGLEDVNFLRLVPLSEQKYIQDNITAAKNQKFDSIIHLNTFLIHKDNNCAEYNLSVKLDFNEKFIYIVALDTSNIIIDHEASDNLAGINSYNPSDINLALTWETDNSNNSLNYNQAWLKFFESDLVTEQNLSWLNRIKYDEQKHISDQFTSCLKSQTNFEAEFSLINHSGQEIFVTCKAKPKYLNNKFIGYAFIALDISRLIKKKQFLLDKSNRLEKSNQELERFAYLASHDLKEPVRKVVAFGDRLTKNLEDVKLNSKGRFYLERMIDAADRMHVLLDDLLIYSRVNEERLSMVSFVLEDQLSEIIEEYEYKNPKSSIKYINNLTEEYLVKADTQQLKYLIDSLLSNAFKFRKIDKNNHTVNLVLEEDREYIIISVEDNGIGIEAQYFERIFGQFQRLHARTDYPGSGMGLAIVKKIVDLHNFKMKVQSEVGIGSCFSVCIPMAQVSLNMHNEYC
jgi:signal transduction histidine kinase